jgi:hypothetical protein
MAMAGLSEAGVSPEIFLLFLTVVDLSHIFKKGKQMLAYKTHQQINQKKVKYETH